MSSIDITLHSQSKAELADQLRAMAERLDTPEQSLPVAGEESLVYHKGKLAGVISSPGVITDADRANLARAALAGDCRMMERIGNAQSALVQVLQYHRLDELTKEGLLIALDELASRLIERTDFIEDECFIPGAQDDDNHSRDD